MTADTAEREAFEKWCKAAPEGWRLDTPSRWMAFQAGWQARAALPARAPEGWTFSVHESDGRTWLRIRNPAGTEAALSTATAGGGGKSICAQVLDHLKDALSAAPPPPEQKEKPPSSLDEPSAWWAETGTSGRGEGCNKPFWLRHEAIEYVRQHGGHIAPLYRRYSTEPLASPAPGPAGPVADTPTSEADFVAGIQGFASMCESAARSGGMGPSDCNMVAAKLRDAAFVVDQIQKLRDGKIALGWELRPPLEGGGAPPASDERVAAMRERCAALADSWAMFTPEQRAVAIAIADRIRALPLDGEG